MLPSQPETLHNVSVSSPKLRRIAAWLLKSPAYPLCLLHALGCFCIRVLALIFLLCYLFISAFGRFLGVCMEIPDFLLKVCAAEK